jgi:hypothetical protein
MSQKPLTPEQTRAYDTVMKWLPGREEKMDDPVRVETGFLTFSHSLICLPIEKDWVWNQSLRKVEGTFEEGSYILSKSTARKRRGVYGKAPSYKMWIFSLRLDCLLHPLHAVWCERGRDLPVTLSCPVISPDLASFSPSAQPKQTLIEWDVLLHSLSFLAPFTTEKLAREFGWL